jgi:dethiobiotin synthetase
MIDRVFVTATDTDVGKTVFCAGLVGLLGAHYWKPVQAGLSVETDTQAVQRLAQISPSRTLPEAWRLGSPLSPHRAAELDGVQIEPATLAIPDRPRPLVIEGAGGLLVPLTRKSLLIDLLARWAIPTVVCARTRLGTINHTLLSLEALRRRAIPLLGVAFIGEAQPDTQAIVSDLGAVRVLGRLPWIEPLTPRGLADAFASAFTPAAFEMTPARSGAP